MTRTESRQDNRSNQPFWIGLLVLYVLCLFQTPVIAAPYPPSIPTEKAWCCTGGEPGVFDLSGTWKGINPHNPTPSAFPGAEFFYEDLGSSGQSLMTFELVGQELMAPHESGGQQVIQTYTGKLVQTWYEHPNNNIEICLVSPQASKDMCEYVRKVANYDLEFSVRWCKAADGFYLHSLVATDLTLTFTDALRTLASRMVINPVAGDFCTTMVPVGIKNVTYDYEENLIAGFTPGGQLMFTTPAPNPYDVLEFTTGTRDNCWCEGGGTNLPKFSMIKKLGPADIAELKGDIRFTVSSDMPLDLVETPFEPLGEFTLLKQSGAVRARNPGETDLDWNNYLESVKDVFTFMDDVASFDGSEYRYSNLPLYDIVQIGGRDVVRPARYTLRLRGLNVEEYVTGSNPLVTQFTLFSGADAFNVQTGELVALTVTPLDAIPIKKNLIEELRAMSPTRYIVPENLALNHVTNLEAGSPSDAQLEGLNRAILAERVARDGARFGEQQIKIMLDGLNGVMASLIEHLFSKFGTTKQLKEKQKVQSKLQDELDTSLLAGDGWTSIPGDAEVVKDSMKSLVDANFDLKLSNIAARIKSWLGAALAMLKDGLISAGLAPEKAELVSSVVSGVINTVLDVVITQGVGALQTAAIEAVKFAISSAQDDLFETLPGSYTDDTLPAVTYSQQQMVAWTTDNENAYREDRRMTEGELIQLGVEAYENIGTANALSIVSSGFANASSVLDTFSKIPVISKAQAVAKVGQFITGASSFVIPLKGAYWDTPERVRAGVAKAYGELPGDVFLVAEGAAGEVAEGTAALPNGMGSNVIEPLRATLNLIRTRLGTSFGNLGHRWNGDSIDDVLDILTGNGTNDIPALFDQFERQLADYLAMSGAFAGNHITASQAQSAFVRSSVGFEHRMDGFRAEQLSLLMDVLTREFSGPTDSTYIAQKAVMSQNLVKLGNAARGLRLAAQEFGLLSNSQPFKSAVVLRNVTLTSQATSLDMVTQANETFDLSVSVRNLGQSAVTGVEVELTQPLALPLTIVSSAIQAAGTGNLAANDGSPGSGSDEAIVTWQIQYTGPLDDQVNIPLLIESRSTTVDDPGQYSEGYAALSVDPLVFDPDGDGMPTAWENANGLNAAVDDGEDDDDMDDVTNAEEFERGLNPQVADSDIDGLEDGDEIAGVNGWITNPGDDDTDDDGVLDGTDGSPLDPTTSAAATGIEPIVALGTNQVTLNDELPQADVAVNNSGTGSLIWAAITANNALVLTGTAAQPVQAGSVLTLQLAPGLDVAANNGKQVDIIVRDLAGAHPDQQVLTVTIGDSPEPPEVIHADGFESP